MRHFVAMRVAEGFCQRAARANPAGIGAFPPAPNEQRNQDEGLQERNREPRPQRLLRENVPDEKWPCENEAERAPVFTGATIRSHREERVRDGFPPAAIKPPMVARPRKNEVRKR